MKKSDTNSSGAAQLPPPKRKLFPVNPLVQRNPGLTPGGVRWDLFNRKANGLEESGAVVYRGRNILLDEDLYLDWLASGSQQGAA